MIRSRFARRLVLSSAAGLLLAGFGTAPAVAAPAAPDPSTVTVTELGYDGTGCPAGSVGMSFSNDRSAFTMIFDQFVASSGPGIPATESRKDCRITVGLKAPAGWSWAVGQLDARGYVQLPANATAESGFTASAGNQPLPPQKMTFTGPVSKAYLFRSVSPVTNLNWSACGGTNRLTLNEQVRVTAPAGTSAQATIDSLDGKITSGPGKRRDATIVWTRCST